MSSAFFVFVIIDDQLSSDYQAFMRPLLRDHTVPHQLLSLLVGAYQGLLLPTCFKMHLLRWNIIVITMWILLIVLELIYVSSLWWLMWDFVFVQVILLESQDRIGGRIHTDYSFGCPVDMGASWLVLFFLLQTLFLKVMRVL